MSKRPALACHERMEQLGVRALADVELLTILLGPTPGVNSTRDAAQRLLDALPLSQIAWASADELQQHPGIGRARAAAIAAAFELGRRGAWAPPKRGERVLDPRRVYALMRPLAHAEREEFHTVLLDVRGQLIKTVKIAEGSLTQCPVSPRDALREPVRIGRPRSGSGRRDRPRGEARCVNSGSHTAVSTASDVPSSWRRRRMTTLSGARRRSSGQGCTASTSPIISAGVSSSRKR